MPCSLNIVKMGGVKFHTYARLFLRFVVCLREQVGDCFVGVHC